VKKYEVGGFVLLVSLFLAITATSVLAFSITTRDGLAGETPSDGQSLRPGQIQWTHYETTQPFDTCASTSAPEACKSGGAGDNILRLVNPNGSANPALLIGPEQTVCAMIYVLDDDQEMGECCGCPLSSVKMASFSVEHNLLSNFVLGGANDYGNGAIAIIAADQNPNLVALPPSKTNGQGCPASQSGACNTGCDPTNVPGYAVTTVNNLLGSVTHDQYVEAISGSVSGITETALFDDGQGNEANVLYLQFQCGILVGNGSGAGACSCPNEPNVGG
jgi:hypothetical protein